MRLLRLYPKPKLWSNEWFEAWQVFLLLGVNSPFKGMREEVRSRLGIILDRNIPVDRLLRNSFRISLGKNSKGEREYQETFYGKPVFAIALKREWLWFWNLVHKWDMNFANHLCPKFNLGFDTLTVYPNVFGVGTTDDAYGGVYIVDDTNWDTLRWASKTFEPNSTSPEAFFGRLRYFYDDSFYKFELTRYGFTATTSALTNLATITAADFNIRTGTKYINGFPQTGLDIVEYNPNNAGGLADHDFLAFRFGTTAYSTKNYASMTNNTNLTFSLNASGISNISKTAISKFGTRLAFDTANNFTGPVVDDYQLFFNGYQTDTTTQEYRPNLTVTYTLPATNIPRMDIQNIMTQIRM